MFEIFSLVAWAFKRASCTACCLSCGAFITSSAGCVSCLESSVVTLPTVIPVVITPEKLDVITVVVTEVKGTEMEVGPAIIASGSLFLSWSFYTQRFIIHFLRHRNSNRKWRISSYCRFRRILFDNYIRVKRQ